MPSEGPQWDRPDTGPDRDLAKTHHRRKRWERRKLENVRESILAFFLISPPQQNLWVRFGSGSCPRLCNRASFATLTVRKPYDFLVTSFTLLLRPSTAPLRPALEPGTNSG